MKKDVCAVILAAGKGSRMGEVKQLLPIGQKSMLEHAIDRVLEAGFSKTYVVIGYHEALIREKITRRDGRVHWLINQNYQEGQSTSLRLAFHQLKESYDHMMLFLGDVPCIQQNTMEYIYDESMNIATHNEAPFMLRPTFNGINGHPVFIANFFHDIFMQIKGDSGLRSVVHQLADNFTKEVNDEGIILDVDTMEQYEQIREIYEKGHKKL